MKVQAGGGRPAFGIPVPSRAGAPETRRVHLWKWRSLRAHGWDPKEVNYARTGRGQRNSVEVRSGLDVQIDRQIWVLAA
ncbi:hypothetical protein JTE90_014221 [Oedothorax gibbosus]|uniref:Uncharacterized protein n=1 Tax=Oedothorax gibbosus TaxID=931172 RepID=A0AAV6TDK2_9ARAC|nr:hypothetical protein JTE90_014221 [Oedothorax gibbosus]